VEFLSGCGAAAGSSWNMEELSPTKTFWTIHFFKTTHSLLVTKWLPIYIHTYTYIYMYMVTPPARPLYIFIFIFADILGLL
jgi:hypothetical protein